MEDSDWSQIISLYMQERSDRSIFYLLKIVCPVIGKLHRYKLYILIIYLYYTYDYTPIQAISKAI